VVADALPSARANSKLPVVLMFVAAVTSVAAPHEMGAAWSKGAPTMTLMRAISFLSRFDGLIFIGKSR
jgi:hypothetical protein